MNFVHLFFSLLLFTFALQVNANPLQSESDRRDYIVEFAWLDDPSNSLGPDQVKDLVFKPYANPLRRGFTASTTWIRLRIDPSIRQGRVNASRTEQLVLRIMPHHLDEIVVFDPRRVGRQPLIAGDRHELRAAQYISFNQNIVIDFPQETIDIFLRLRTTSNHGIHIQALLWEDVEEIDRLQQVAFGAIAMFVVAVLLWSILSWFEQRDRLIGVFIVHQAISVLFVFFVLGFVRVYLSNLLPAPTIDRLHSGVYVLTATSVLWFHWHLLRKFSPPAVAMKILRFVSIATPLNLILMVADYTSLALKITMITVLVGSPFMLMLAVFTSKKDEGKPTMLNRSHLIAIHGLVTGILITATLPALGLKLIPSMAMYSAVTYGVVNALVLILALRSRVKHLEFNQKQAQVQLTLAEERAQREIFNRREQDQFTAMLTHELGNSLTVVQLAIGQLNDDSTMRKRGYRAVEAMRQIVDRCALTFRHEAMAPSLEVSEVDLRLLVEDLCQRMAFPASIELSSSPEIPACKIDKQLISIVVGNLLENALKYRADSTPVTVSINLESKGERNGLRLSVANWPGLAGRPDPKHLFAKYWRGAHSTHISGTGLGLYLSSLIASRLGTELVYEPEGDQVRFSLWLPV